MIVNGQWAWPVNWLDEFPILNNIPIPSIATDSKDKYMWCTKDGKVVNYNTKTVWNDLRQRGNNVIWHDLVWFSNCTPKHSFIVWIAILGRLSTQDRLKKWYPDKNMTCSLCENCFDSLNHLFFECSYSIKVWKELKKKAELEDLPNSWEDIVRRMSNIKHNRSIRSVLVEF